MTGRSDQARRLGGALGWSVAARLARMVLGLAGTFLVVRGLGAHDYGILAVIRTALAYLAIVVGAGLSQGLLRYLPVWRMSADRGRILRILVTTLVTHVVLWGTFCLALVLGRAWLGTWTGEGVAGLLILGTVLLLPEVLGHSATNVCNAYYDTRAISMAVLLSAAVYLGVVYWVLAAGWSVKGVLVAAAVSHLVLSVFLAARIPGYVNRPPELTTGQVSDPPPVRRALHYSIPFVAIGILNLITWRQSEVLFLGHYHGANAAGFFDLAYRLPQTVLEFIPGAIWPLVMAGSAEAFVRDPQALQRTSSAYYKLLFLLAAPLGVGGVLVGDRLIAHLGGGEFLAAGVFAQVFFALMSFSFLATPLSMVFYVVERPWVAFRLYLINAAVNVGLDFLLIPRYGLWGAVIPVSIVILASPFLNAWVLKRVGIAIHPPLGFLVRIYSASGLMLLLWPLRAYCWGPLGTMTLILIGAVVFAVGVRLFRVFGKAERDLMERASPAVWHLLQPVLAGRPSRETS